MGKFMGEHQGDSKDRRDQHKMDKNTFDQVHSRWVKKKVEETDDLLKWSVSRQVLYCAKPTQWAS